VLLAARRKSETKAHKKKGNAEDIIDILIDSSTPLTSPTNGSRHKDTLFMLSLLAKDRVVGRPFEGVSLNKTASKTRYKYRAMLGAQGAGSVISNFSSEEEAGAAVDLASVFAR
jgi:hypothetical protein